MADAFNKTFEDSNLTGTVLSFDSAVTNGGNLSVAAAAALNGSRYGVNCYLANTNAQYGQITLSSVKRYRIKTWFDYNSVTFPSGGVMSTVVYYGTAGVPIARWKLVYVSGTFKLRLAARLDSGSDSESPDLAISDAPHRVEMDFFIGDAGENNGFLIIWIDETSYELLTGLDNDTVNVNKVRIGAPLGPDSGTSGTVYLDGIRLNYTGDPIREMSVVKRFAGVQLATRRRREQRPMVGMW